MGNYHGQSTKQIPGTKLGVLSKNRKVLLRFSLPVLGGMLIGLVAFLIMKLMGKHFSF
jgi:hypothetical protein